MSHNVIECIFQGEKQTRLYMIFLCVLLLRNEVYVFQSDWPHVHINFPLAHHRLHLEISIVVVKRQTMFRTELHQCFDTFSRTLFVGDRDRIDDILLRAWLTMPAWAVPCTGSILIARKADQLVEPRDLRAVSAVECPITLTCPECQPWLRECHNVAFLGIGKRTSLECGFTLLFSTIKASDGTLLVLTQRTLLRGLRLLWKNRKSNRFVLNRLRIAVLTRPSPAFKAGVVGNGSLNIIGQQYMTALSGVKDLGLLGVDIVIFRASDRVLIAIPQRI